MRSGPRFHPLLLGLTALGVACSDGSSTSGTAPGADVANLGLAFEKVRHGGDLIAFTVDETVQGPGDFNGDGDSADFVLHVRDLSAGTTANLALAVFDFRVEARRVAFLVSEFRQAQTDLNGDGDALDNVLHVYDAGTGTTTNVGLAGLSGFELEGGVLAFQVPEIGQGADLNGDGDQTDDVLHLLDLASGVTTDLGLAVEGMAHLDAGFVAFAVSEAEQSGGDLNGDGDSGDRVLHVYSPGAGTTNLGLAVSTLFLAGTFVEIEFENGLIAANVREPDQGIDLNGDGVLDDNVLHVHEVAGGTTTNLALSVRAPHYRVGEGFVAFWVSEGQNGNSDFNNDGDDLDDVLQVFDVASGLTTNTRLAVFRVTLEEELIFCEVLERDQAGADLNGDGDALDGALILYDASTGIIDNPVAAGERPRRIGPDLIAFEVLELSQGDADLNGDGDTLDRVLFLYDLSFFITTNLEVSGRILDADDRYLVYVEFEETADLNGDGDALDPVLHFLDTQTGRIVNAGIAGTATDANGLPLGFEGGVLPFAANELLQGQSDLNGDGDAFDDEVLVLVEPPR